MLIPSYNPGPKVYETVAAARAHWNPVWVVVDGSTDGSAERLTALAAEDQGLKVLVLARNRGKGSAVAYGAGRAREAGFTHILAMDSDGQHPPDHIQAFMQASMAAPDALILGEPQFDASAPLLRVRGRKVSNWFANLWTLWVGIHDSLFGFRVYPIVPLLRVMRWQPWMRRFDFDVEAAVRLCWLGLQPLNLSAAVRYFSPEDGGVTHFNYWRDNLLLSWMHLRLLLGFLLRLPRLAWRRALRRRPALR